jgi:hypothetical protein
MVMSVSVYANVTRRLWAEGQVASGGGEQIHIRFAAAIR